MTVYHTHNGESVIIRFSMPSVYISGRRCYPAVLTDTKGEARRGGYVPVIDAKRLMLENQRSREERYLLTA